MHFHYIAAPLEADTSYQAPPSTIYTPQQIGMVNLDLTPKHIAIILDGNRRWAKKHLLMREDGHREGGDVLLDVVKGAKELGVQVVTVYGFSTENWTRSSIETRCIFNVIDKLLTDQCEEMVQNGIRLATIGDLRRLPDHVNRTIIETKRATAHCDQLDLVLALNYGGRDEICRAFQQMAKDCLSNKLNIDQITESVVERYLDTAAWPNPELLIRTSGEKRISNFLLWQIPYSEVYFAPVLWPDFTPQHLLEAVIDYQRRERRLGGEGNGAA